jgi:hypothetical protein
VRLFACILFVLKLCLFFFLLPPLMQIDNILIFFNWDNIKEHPIPLIVISTLILSWIILAIIYRSCTKWKCCSDTRIKISDEPDSWSIWEFCFGSIRRDNFVFFSSTTDPETFFVSRLRQYGIVTTALIPWYKDNSWRQVAWNYLPSALLGQHN